MDRETLDRAKAAEAVALGALIQPMLAGKPPEVQSAALADLVAIWLAGHQVVGDVAATRSKRAELLAIFLKAVSNLVPVNAHLLGTVAG